MVLLIAIMAMMMVLAFFHELFEMLTEPVRNLSLRRTPSRGEKEGGKHVKHKGGKEVKEGREGGKQMKQVEEEVDNM